MCTHLLFVIYASTVLVIHVTIVMLQLTLCGQTPETAMTSALASVNFYIGQVELQAQLRQSQLQRKLEKVQEACKKKLQEVHNGYTQVQSAFVPSSHKALPFDHHMM